MLESIFILIVAMAFILFILGILEENIVFTATSLLMWIVTLAGQVYIEVPGVSSTYSEIAFFGISIAFIAINVIWMIVILTDFSYWDQRRLP